MTGRTAQRSEPAEGADIDEIQRDLAYTREHLGETFEQLTDRLAEKSRPLAYAAAATVATAVAVVVCVVLWRRRR
ncbi:DUF3618 domain-containing protein [Phytoactinopolyspora halotolerans]|uniref:DUF3618 domain-containing protein n=1 Tax=Phytoactinopolyspora halotolerans TaxID=1981512 RepID=A0A6L9S0R4_9ACTN|nr:DUF3618 domain-containing protein [Phytoactinopolyspora halotolerans]NED98755.1 DUF3618 domain-containing protein [Phytoactinopolyspora halotolerans]